MTNNTGFESPFTAILRGDEPGEIIARDDIRRFAIIESLEPEAAIHWIVVPFEAGESTEQFAQSNPKRFLDLVEYAIEQTQSRSSEFPALAGGFTMKVHFGAYETVPHAKLHILSAE